MKIIQTLLRIHFFKPFKFVSRRKGDETSIWTYPKLDLNKIKHKAKREVNEMLKDLWLYQSKNPKGYT